MTRWGIIGAGNIANRFCESLEHIKGAELYAVSGRNMDKLKAFADTHPCRKIYEGYENLLNDPDVEAVYIALPHHMHAEWIIRSAEAKKDILCEKPAVCTYEEAFKVKEAVEKNHVFFMEGMKNVFEPVMKDIDLQKIGKIQSISLQHGFVFPEEQFGKTYHTTKEAGGCLWDIGCYGLGMLSQFVKGDIEILDTHANLYQGVDFYVQSQFKIKDIEAELTCAFDRNLESKAVITGEHVTYFLKPMHRPDTLIIKGNGKEETIHIPYAYDDFYAEIEAFEHTRTSHNPSLFSVDDTCMTARWSDMIRDTWRTYTEEDLKIIEEQEKAFPIKEFTSAFALHLAEVIIAKSQNYDRGIALQIIRETDGCPVMQYVSDDKKASNLKYIAGKYEAVKQFSHSSAWLYVARQLGCVPETDALPAGGAFPLFDEAGNHIASVCVSGLHEGKDHDLIIEALEAVTKKTAPKFRKVLL